MKALYRGRVVEVEAFPSEKLNESLGLCEIIKKYCLETLIKIFD